jgi:hypothetical protein
MSLWTQRSETETLVLVAGVFVYVGEEVVVNVVVNQLGTAAVRMKRDHARCSFIHPSIHPSIRFRLLCTVVF